MTRRAFSGALAGVAVLPGLVSGGSSRVVILKAIAGPRLPETLALHGSFLPEGMRNRLWELRTYRANIADLESHLAGVFPRAGIRPAHRELTGKELTYLIPFENLAARERAWTALNADPEWARLQPQFRSYRFGLYLFDHYGVA